MIGRNSLWTVGLWVGVAVGAAGLSSRMHAQDAPAGVGPALPPVDYNWQVRPILADNCFSCHGLDATKRRAGLRLDQAEGAYARAIVRNKPDESDLFRHPVRRRVGVAINVRCAASRWPTSS